MNRRTTTLLIVIVVIALEIGWHWYQTIQLRGLAQRSDRPVQLQKLPVARPCQCPAIPEPPPFKWYNRRCIRELGAPIPPAQRGPAAEAGGEK